MCFFNTKLQGRKNQFSSIFRLNVLRVCNEFIEKRLKTASKSPWLLFSRFFRRLMPGVKRISSTLGNEFSPRFHANICRQTDRFRVHEKRVIGKPTREEKIQQSTEDFLSVYFFVFIHRWLKYQRAWLKTGKFFLNLNDFYREWKILLNHSIEHKGKGKKRQILKLIFFLNCHRFKHENSRDGK